VFLREQLAQKNLPTRVGVNQIRSRLFRVGAQSPHACGGEPLVGVIGIDPQVNLPTRVGVNRESANRPLDMVKSPHACGGEPQALSGLSHHTVISPRVWG